MLTIVAMHIRVVSVLILLLSSACWCRHVDDSDEPDSPVEREAIQKLRQKFEKACLRNSESNVTHAEVMEAIGSVPICFYAKMDVQRLVDEWVDLNQNTRVDFFTKYCSVVKSATETCLRPVEALGVRCMDPGAERVESPDFPMYILPQMVELLCENHGAILFADSNGSPTACFGNYFSYIKSCMKNFVSGTNSQLRQNYGEEECRTVETARHCVADKLSKCGNPDLIKVFDLPYHAIVNQTACKDFVKLT